MRIDTATSAGYSPNYNKKNDPEQGIQSLFSAILNEQGRDGYLTADEVAPVTVADGTGESFEPLIPDAWQSWFHSVHVARYFTLKDPTQTAADFQSILEDAYRVDAYIAPQAYVKSLDKDQLATLQAIHHLADPIKPDGLTEEGALNLLLPPDAQIDLNGDGLTQSGKANLIRFPDSRTPPSVAAAWEEATANMLPGDKLMQELRMKREVMFANMRPSADGKTVIVTEPGDPNWRNPYADSGYSYVDKARKVIESTEYFKNQISPEQYQRDMEFWTKLRDALLKHRAP